jgi:hypothetical protein
MTQRPRYPRSSCCVIGCRRTSTLFPGEWICGPHYRMVDRQIKQRRTKFTRQRRREWEAAKATYDAARQEWSDCKARPRPSEMIDRLHLRQMNYMAADRAFTVTADLFWRRIKRQATERALGISA